MENKRPNPWLWLIPLLPAIGTCCSCFSLGWEHPLTGGLKAVSLLLVGIVAWQFGQGSR